MGSCCVGLEVEDWLWGTLENGRKAGVSSAESSSESSSAEETGFKGALLFDFEVGKRGRRVNIRL